MPSKLKGKGPLKQLEILLALTLASVIIAFNLKSFVHTGGLFPGGLSGITVLIQQISITFLDTKLPYSIIYVALNLAPTYIGFKFIGKRFTLYSFYVVALSGILTDLFPSITITYDTLLISIFGGIINGVAISLCLIFGASGGGSDFISIFLSEKKSIDAWNYILGANIILLTTAGLLFGFDRALYSIIYQFSTTQILNTLYKRYQKDTLFIVTERPFDVYEKIRELTHHDATIINGIGCFGGSEKAILYSVVGRSQVDKVVPSIKALDPKAFINVIKTERITGRFYTPPTE